MRARKRPWALVGFLAAYAFVGLVRLLADRLEYDLFENPPSKPRGPHAWEIAFAFHELRVFVQAELEPTLVLATFAVGLVVAVRALAVARFRLTGKDYLARPRNWVAKRQGALLLPSLLPILAYSLSDQADLWGWLLVHGGWENKLWNSMRVLWIVGSCVSVRALLGALLASLPKAEAADEARLSDHEVRFSAVAVTRETRWAVRALAFVTLGMLLAFVSVSPAWFEDSRAFTALALYTATVFAAVVLFRRSSKIAVGLDGVSIAGTSRERFFPYAELDAARLTSWGDLVLERDSKEVLRLQLHGDDAVRREPLAERIRRSIDHAKTRSSGAVARLIEAASPRELERAASGEGHYRAPAATRDELWEIVESPSSRADARIAAARALTTTRAAGDDARLRTAAERCADPVARRALSAMVSDFDGDAAAVEEAELAEHPAAPRRTLGSS